MTPDIVHADTEANQVSEAMARMRDLVLRKAPVLMRAGRNTYSKGKYSTLTPDQKAEALRRIHAGDTLASIQRHLGCSYDSLRNLKNPRHKK